MNMMFQMNGMMFGGGPPTNDTVGTNRYMRAASGA